MINQRIPEGFRQGNYYLREYVSRLEAAVNIARKIIAKDISPFDRMEARIELRKAIARLDGENM